jgi:hypothetical protein
MLRRSAGAPGHVTWRQFARKGSHGRYYPAISFEKCLMLAQEVKEYENAYLTQQISFLETIQDFFSVHNLLHDQERYNLQMRSFFHGDPVTIMVFHQGELKEHRLVQNDVGHLNPNVPFF